MRKIARDRARDYDKMMKRRAKIDQERSHLLSIVEEARLASTCLGCFDDFSLGPTKHEKNNIKNKKNMFLYDYISNK